MIKNKEKGNQIILKEEDFDDEGPDDSSDSYYNNEKLTSRKTKIKNKKNKFNNTNKSLSEETFTIIDKENKQTKEKIFKRTNKESCIDNKAKKKKIIKTQKKTSNKLRNPEKTVKKKLLNICGTEPYQCESCEYSCRRKSDLRTHTDSVHRRLKPFLCEICSFTSSRRDNLRNHIRSVHHQEKPYSCSECSYVAGR